MSNIHEKSTTSTKKAPNDNNQQSAMNTKSYVNNTGNKSSSMKHGNDDRYLSEAHMTLSEAAKLNVYDKIDHRDGVGRFVYGTVIEKKGRNLKIHYDGWSDTWDTWTDYKKEINRFAHAGTISKRPSHRFKGLKKGDFIDINPRQRHPGWKCGEIRLRFRWFIIGSTNPFICHS